MNIVFSRLAWSGIVLIVASVTASAQIAPGISIPSQRPEIMPVPPPAVDSTRRPDPNRDDTVLQSPRPQPVQPSLPNVQLPTPPPAKWPFDSRMNIQVVNPTPSEPGRAPETPPAGSGLEVTSGGTLNRRPPRTYPEEFRYVVAIAIHNEFKCSGVWLGQGWVATAAHCVTWEEISSPRKLVKHEDSAIAVFLESSKGTSCYVPYRANTATACGRERLAVKQNVIDAAFFEPVATAASDFALLKVDLPVETPRAVQLPSIRQLAARATLIGRPVMLAGYGFTDNPTRRPGMNVFLGPVESAAIVIDRGQIEFTPLREDSNVCDFDSGGLILDGFAAGYPEERHVVLGTVVGNADGFRASHSGDASPCRKGTGVGTSFLHIPVRGLICQSAPEIPGACECLQPGSC